VTATACPRVRVLLDAFVDGELEPRQRAQVRRHLEACARCRHEVEARRALGTLIHVTLRGRAGMTAEQREGLPGQVVLRRMVERDQAWSTFLRDGIQAPPLRWAATGATLALLACLLAGALTLRLTQQWQPGSLAALIDVLANPGSNDNPVRLDEWMKAPESKPDLSAFLPVTELPGQDATVALSAVVTREGRVRHLSVIDGGWRRTGRLDRRALSAVLEAAAHTEFRPATAAKGTPVAVSMVWVLAHTTVTGALPADELGATGASH
jgi:hypothetical protein